MKVLFCHSYFLHLDTKQVAHAQPYPPLGTIWAAALLRQHGFDVALFDVMFVRSPEALTARLDSYRPDILVIYDDGFNYLTKMCLSNMRHAAFRMQELAKTQGCTVIVSGSDATDHYPEYLDNGADYILLGEAEYSLLALVTALQQGDTDKNTIAGIAYREKGGVHKTGSRPVIRHLDELPLPAWDLVDITPYKKTWLQKHGYFSINIATTRGCPYKCNWCAKPIYGNNYNMRSPGQIVQEISLLQRLFQMQHIWFCDDIFGLKRSWVAEFSELIREQGLRIRYKIQSRADLLVQEQYVTHLAASGCGEVWMGAESGSQKVLDAMDKGTTVAQIKTARALLKKHGVNASFFIQYGYPGETKEDISSTLSLIADTLPDDIGISVSYPLPGTLFYENVKKEISGKSNWEDSDDLDMMFRSTFPKAFYKLLHRYTHYFYRYQKLKAAPGFSLTGRLKMIKYFLLQQQYQRRLNKSAHGF